jgi:hypothetical protein
VAGRLQEGRDAGLTVRDRSRSTGEPLLERPAGAKGELGSAFGAEVYVFWRGRGRRTVPDTPRIAQVREIPP